MRLLRLPGVCTGLLELQTPQPRLLYFNSYYTILYTCVKEMFAKNYNFFKKLSPDVPKSLCSKKLRYKNPYYVPRFPVIVFMIRLKN